MNTVGFASISLPTSMLSCFSAPLLVASSQRSQLGLFSQSFQESLTKEYALNQMGILIIHFRVYSLSKGCWKLWGVCTPHTRGVRGSSQHGGAIAARLVDVSRGYRNPNSRSLASSMEIIKEKNRSRVVPWKSVLSCASGRPPQDMAALAFCALWRYIPTGI